MSVRSNTMENKMKIPDIVESANKIDNTMENKLKIPDITENTNKIDAPDVNDVRLGRGAPVNNHVGNIRFRYIIKEHKERYICAVNNYEKYLIMMMILQVLKGLNPPGRFLREDPKDKRWIVVDEKEAKRKISQALREKPYQYRSRGTTIDEETKRNIFQLFKENAAGRK